MYKIKQRGNYLVVARPNETVFQSINIPKGYSTDKIFSLAYKANDGSVLATKMLEKELDSLVIKIETPVNPVRTERRLLEKAVKEVKKIDIRDLPIHLPEDWSSVVSDFDASEKAAMKNFMLWLSLNDNEYTRNNFLKHFKDAVPYITPNGFIVSVRQVWKTVTEGDDVLYNVIQSGLVKAKGWRRPSRYFSIWQKEDLSYIMVETTRNKYDSSTWTFIGNLDELGESYTKPAAVPTYYSDYNRNKRDKDGNSKREKWKLHEVAEIHDKGVHRDICGINQLHIRTSPITAVNEGGYGDTYIITIVNPKDVINISDGWKYTTSRMYIAAEVSKEEITENFVRSFGKFDYDYMKLDLKDVLAIDLKNDIKKLKADNRPVVSVLLNNKTDHLAPELLTEILKSRIQLL